MNNTMNKKDIMLESLEKNLPTKTIESHLNIDSKIVKDTEDDYAFARGKLKGLIEKSENALETLMTLAQDAEHPRTYEVLSGMLKNTAEITEQLLSLQKQRKELVKEESAPMSRSGDTTNNNIFIGSTSELQKFLRKEKPVLPQ